MPITRGVAWSGPDLDYVSNLLATTAQVSVATRGADAVHVTSEQSVEVAFDVSSAGEAAITLFEGFNMVRADLTLVGRFGPPLFSSAPIRTRRFLYLPGTVAVFEFMCTISPLDADVPTERSIELTAAVQSQPASPLLWSVSAMQVKAA